MIYKSPRDKNLMYLGNFKNTQRLHPLQFTGGRLIAEGGERQIRSRAKD